MSGQYRWLPAIFLAACTGATVAETAQAAEKSQFTCTSGDLVRRVIVEVGDLTTGLPCEVVYWKDKEAPGVRRVLWNARSDAAFCDGKAAGLVDRLATAGWQCDRNGEAVQANAAPAPEAPAVTDTPTAAAAPEQPAAQAPAATSVPALDAAQVATPAPAPQPASPQPQTTAALDSVDTPATATAAPRASLGTDGTITDQNLQTAAVTPGVAAVDQLQSVIEANLSSLNQSVDGDFQAQIGDFGDLNSDGIEDAVVFFNYESSTADFTQFVAAYLFNGESYHLAATKPVGGTDLAVRQVEVESIVDGAIQLRLVLNDASQSGDRRAAMIFKDGQLVETE